LQQRPRTILVLGGDAGESSYCRFLVAQLLGAGERLAIVDADVGQKIVGPPATVTLGHAEGTAEQWTAAAEAFYFVGSTGPVGRMLPLVVGTAQLVNAAGAAFVIVDTTGYIEASGRVLKGYKIDAVRPDLIVAIQKQGSWRLSFGRTPPIPPSVSLPRARPGPGTGGSEILPAKERSPPISRRRNGSSLSSTN
jgi:polynucleotide 5'-hydroxyl-kinase GRC3/NOL9